MTKQSGMVTLRLQTRPNSWVREGLPRTSTPYAQITDITEHQQAATFGPASEATIRHITLPRLVGKRVQQYWDQRFVQPQDPDYPLRNGVEFAAFMITGELGSDREAPFKTLDAIFKSEQSRPLQPDQQLQVGDVAIMGASGGIGDCWCGNCCIVHGAVSLGGEVGKGREVLEANGLGGNLAINKLENGHEYWQNVDFHWKDQPLDVRVYRPDYAE